MERADLIRLLDPEVMALLDSLPPYPPAAQVPATVERLRKQGYSAQIASAVMTQSRLRSRAVAKLGEFAGRMLFTESGLEQATRLRVAAQHAGRFQAAGLDRVADLTCGIGADALAMAALGLHVTAVDADEVTAAIATYNLGIFDNATVRHATAESVDLASYDALYLDPARRTAGHSSTSRVDPDDYVPSLTFAFTVLEKHTAGVKLGPGFPRERIPDGVEAQWVSVSGDLVEMGLWSGRLARDGYARTALLLDGSGTHELAAGADTPDAEVGPLGEYIHEPDGSAIRARLLGELARREGAHMVSSGIAYLTSDVAANSPFLTSFRVRERLPFDVADLKRELRKRDIGVLEIKKRGVDVDPAQLRKRLSLQGKNAATLILTRVDGKHVAILADRVRG